MHLICFRISLHVEWVVGDVVNDEANGYSAWWMNEWMFNRNASLNWFSVRGHDSIIPLITSHQNSKSFINWLPSNNTFRDGNNEFSWFSIKFGYLCSSVCIWKFLQPIGLIKNVELNTISTQIIKYKIEAIKINQK